MPKGFRSVKCFYSGSLSQGPPQHPGRQVAQRWVYKCRASSKEEIICPRSHSASAGPRRPWLLLLAHCLTSSCAPEPCSRLRTQAPSYPHPCKRIRCRFGAQPLYKLDFLPSSIHPALLSKALQFRLRGWEVSLAAFALDRTSLGSASECCPAPWLGLP